jgi:hypothetical protein
MPAGPCVTKVAGTESAALAPKPNHAAAHANATKVAAKLIVNFRAFIIRSSVFLEHLFVVNRHRERSTGGS